MVISISISDEAFKRVDADRSASLTFDEFLHTDLPYEQLKQDEFNALDTDHDGIVTRIEYERYYQKEKQNADDLRAEYFGQLYEEFDKNFDLKLDRSETEEILKKRFSLKPRNNFAQLFASFDKNGDDALNLDEYIQFDATFPFYQLDPLNKSQEKAPEEIKEVDAASEFNTPLLAFKQEKLPMLKRQYSNKY